MDAEPAPFTARRIVDRSVGPLALGCWRLTGRDPGVYAELIESAVDLGITLIDNADVYGLDWGGRGFGTCEETLGAALALRPGLRDRIVLATKGGIVPEVPYVSSATHLREACEASLRRLGVDVIDLYQVHRPDHFTHPAEVAEALTSLVERGLVRSVGVSNHTTAQIRALQAHLDIPLASVQPEFSAASLDCMRDGVLDLCTEMGMAVLAWSPLAGGRLATGDGVRRELIGVLDTIAGDHGVSRAAVAIAFVLSHPSAPMAIVGTTSTKRLHDLSTALSTHLTRVDLYRIIEASDGRPLP